MLHDGRFAADLGPHPPRTLVLLDINMPIMSGFEFLEKIQTEAPAAAADLVVVVMLTSSAFFGDRERALAYPIVEGYIEKPISDGKLQSILERLWPEVVAAR
jgi:CheY-like chemotaxis protein